MISISGADALHKVVVMNPKGGCGKTTLATNLAGWFALHGPPPTIIDCDPQGYCTRWAENRPSDRPKVHCFEAGPLTARSTLEAHAESSIVIIDLPAAITGDQMHSFVYLADSLLLPVAPSEIDVHSATRFIAELLLDAQLDRRRVGIVATRVRERTRSFAMLTRFLGSLRIPLIGALRDSQNFVQAAALGLGVCELPPHRVKDDLPALDGIGQWLEHRKSMTVSRAQRDALIAKAAYRYAEARGFVGGDPRADWLRAAKEVDGIEKGETAGVELARAGQ